MPQVVARLGQSIPVVSIGQNFSIFPGEGPPTDVLQGMEGGRCLPYLQALLECNGEGGLACLCLTMGLPGHGSWLTASSSKQVLLQVLR